MVPNIHINILAVLVSVVASVAFGFLWHGPLFGKIWLRFMNFNGQNRPTTLVMIRSTLLTVLGAFLTTWVLLHSLESWRPSAWGVGLDGPSYHYGFFAAFFTWVGFYVPLLLNTVAWEMRSWSLFSLNAAYHFINLQIICMILAYWR